MSKRNGLAGFDAGWLRGEADDSGGQLRGSRVGIPGSGGNHSRCRRLCLKQEQGRGEQCDDLVHSSI